MNSTINSGRTRHSAMKTQIDENLKRVYETALQEDVPDRFKNLLAQLKAGTAPTLPVTDSDNVKSDVTRDDEARAENT